MMAEWTLTKERVRDPDTRRLTHHLAWHLRFRGRVVAKYRHWRRGIEHIETFYRKWPHERPASAGETSNGK